MPPKVTFIAQIIPQNEKVLPRTRLHLGVGIDLNGNHQEMSPALLQSLSWDLDLITSQTTGLPTSVVHTPIVSFPSSVTPLTLGKLIWDSRTRYLFLPNTVTGNESLPSLLNCGDLLG